jgi:hypothetical protein
MTTSKEDIQTILRSEGTLFSAVADAVNLYCQQNSVECCQGVTAATYDVHVTNTSVVVNVTTSAQCYFARGYPDQWSTPPRSKIIVKARYDTMLEYCTATSGQATTTEIYLNQQSILHALTQYKTDIQNKTGISISDISIE